MSAPLRSNARIKSKTHKFIKCHIFLNMLQIVPWSLETQQQTEFETVSEPYTVKRTGVLVGNFEEVPILKQHIISCNILFSSILQEVQHLLRLNTLRGTKPSFQSLTGTTSTPVRFIWESPPPPPPPTPYVHPQPNITPPLTPFVNLT